ncbi:MAG: hypothetical protein K2G59_02725 [Muribaculaceae bacterium]|nr:hypothetical protein [Muribaculaceae bacterium]
MKTLNQIAAVALAAVVGTTFVGCSSDNDPIKPVDPYPNHVGVSDNYVWFLSNGGEKELTTEADGWVLSEVVMTVSDDVYFGDDDQVSASGTIYDTQFYEPEIKADKPFEYKVNKLTFSYADKKIGIKADKRDDSDYLFVYEFVLKKGDCTETIYCLHDVEGLPDPPVIVATPGELAIPVEGGTFISNITLNYNHTGWWLNTVRVGEKYFAELGIRVDQGDKWSQDFDWLSLEADGPEIIRITVKPNETGVERDFRFAPRMGNYFAPITGTQAAR